MGVDELAFHGTIGEEAQVIRACIAAMTRPGAWHSVASLTTLGHPIFDLLSGGHQYHGFDHGWISQHLHGALRDTVVDFYAKNVKHYPVEPLVEEITRLYVILNDELREIFVENPGGDWPEFKRRYPRVSGIIAVSRVGFDTTMTQAIAQVGVTIDGISGSGMLWLCVKAEREWATASRYDIWSQ